MKILVCGYHNPNFTNTVFYREEAVKYLGHELIVFDDRKFLLPGRIREFFSGLHGWDLNRLNQQLLDFVWQSKPDVCLVVGGQRILPNTIKAIRDKRIPVVLWTTDVPIDFKNILQAAPFYDHLFCAGSEASDIFISKGLNQVTWMPFGCDPKYHKPVSINSEDIGRYSSDLVFVGSYYPNRALLLEEIADLNVRVWGPYWNKLSIDSKLKKKTIDAKINYDQWVKIYSASKLCIVIHYQDPSVPCYQISPKLFEAMACGCFVLTDRQKDLSKIFKDGEHLVCFDDARDLKEKAQYYLEHDAERKRIAIQGHQEVVNRHRYQDRISAMLEIVFKGR